MKSGEAKSLLTFVKHLLWFLPFAAPPLLPLSSVLRMRIAILSSNTNNNVN